MIQRRHVLTGLLAAPAIVERANAQSQFDWKQCKGQSIEVNYQLSQRGDVAKARLASFQEMTGIKVGFEQIPEQQQRPKVAMEMSTGHPSFDVVNVGMHVLKRLVERAKWMEDLRPYIADPSLTNPDFDISDFAQGSMRTATGPDGKINVLPLHEGPFILYWNKEIFARKGFTEPPKTLTEMLTMARALTDPANGIYGFVGRGLKNANVVLYTNILLGWDQETVTPDGKTLLTDSPAAIEAATWFQTIMRECAPPGVIAFNWNEAQTTFMQGRAAMWWDSLGSAAPLMDPTKSKIAGKVGFSPPPGGPKGQWSVAFLDAIGIPAAAKNKKAAWLYAQWATGKSMMDELLRAGSGVPPRLSPYKKKEITEGGKFPKEFFDCTVASLKIIRSGLPVIVPVTEFRDTIGAGLSNLIGGADPATEMKRVTAAFQPVLNKSNEV